MPDIDRDLTRDEILSMLTDLGRKMQRDGLETNIHVVGGAAIALTLKDGRVTQDVDALVSDHSDEFRAAAREVAEEHNVRADWISDDVSDFVAREPAGEETEIALPGINVFVASPEHLLAMKVRAATTRFQQKDTDDLVFLADHLGLTTPDEIADLTARQFQGIYRDTIGVDEYRETVENAFVMHDLENGIDPTLRQPRSTPSAQEDDTFDGDFFSKLRHGVESGASRATFMDDEVDDRYEANFLDDEDEFGL